MISPQERQKRQEEFTKPLIDLKGVIEDAWLHCQTWSALKHDIPPLRPAQIPEGILVFFQNARAAHFKCMVINLYKILDPFRQGTKTAASLPNLLNEAFQIGIIDDVERGEARGRIAAIRPTWEKIRVLRHRIFAHTESGAYADDIFAQQNLLAEDFEKLIEGALHALEVIWSKHVSRGHAVLNFERNYFRESTKEFANSVLAQFKKAE